MEIAQYIYSGLNLLDYLLSETRKGSEIDLQEPITESERRQLKYKIKDYRKVKYVSSNHIEHFENALRGS